MNVEAFYSPSWVAETEIAVVELGNRPASALMDRGHAWTRCWECGRYRRMGYCRPLVMSGMDTCGSCKSQMGERA